VDIDWGQAVRIALVGFFGVFIILLILSICVGLTSKLTRLFERKPVEAKKKKEEAIAE
jgi:Na+-transporting methylmalonyl-CoA/oxaloacetate decarboxylase gamma subunit